jgi:hypothetical protein
MVSSAGVNTVVLGALGSIGASAVVGRLRHFFTSFTGFGFRECRAARDRVRGRAVALEAFPLSRALGNINFMDSVDQLALVTAGQCHTAQAARLCGFADAYGRKYAMSR